MRDGSQTRTPRAWGVVLPNAGNQRDVRGLYSGCVVCGTVDGNNNAATATKSTAFTDRPDTHRRADTCTNAGPNTAADAVAVNSS